MEIITETIVRDMVAEMDKLKEDIVAYLTISLAQIKAGNWLEIEANLKRALYKVSRFNRERIGYKAAYEKEFGPLDLKVA